MEALKTSLSDGVATAIEGADMDKVNAALDIVKGNVETSASTKFGAGYNVTMPLTVTFDYSVSNPTMPSYMFPSSSFNITPKKHAAGGYVSGIHSCHGWQRRAGESSSFLRIRAAGQTRLIYTRKPVQLWAFRNTQRAVMWLAQIQA